MWRRPQSKAWQRKWRGEIGNMAINLSGGRQKINGGGACGSWRKIKAEMLYQ